MRRSVLLAACALLTAGCAGNVVAGMGVGQSPPDFALPALDGEVGRLSDFRGSPVFLDFWATWCGPCRESLPETAELHEQYQDAGLKVFAIDVGETEAQVKAYLAAGGIEVPVLMDADKKVSDIYSIAGIPTFILLDANHTIRFYATGYRRSLPQEVRAELQAMGLKPSR